jgi:hypothetical protein
MAGGKGWWQYWREEGSGRGGLGTKETRADRGMVVGGNEETLRYRTLRKHPMVREFSSKSTYM